LASKIRARRVCTPAASLLGKCTDDCASLRIAGREIAGQRLEEFDPLAFGTGAIAR
jgi:hypothetical protein